LLLGLLLVGGTIIAYHPVWHAGFVFDDDIHIRQNRMLFDPDGLKQIWTSLESPQYYPMVFTSFRLEQALWGLSPSGYHWINLLLHAASVVLVWRVLRRLGLPGAWLAAAIFAVHPVNVESVAWISERKNALSMPFYLLSLLLYLRFDDQSEVQSPRSKVRSRESGVGGQESERRITDHASPITPFSLLTFLLAVPERVCAGAVEQDGGGAPPGGVAGPGLVAARTGHEQRHVAQRAVFRGGVAPGADHGLVRASPDFRPCGAGG
jgi:hypothetical protein